MQNKVHRSIVMVLLGLVIGAPLPLGAQLPVAMGDEFQVNAYTTDDQMRRATTWWPGIPPSPRTVR